MMESFETTPQKFAPHLWLHDVRLEGYDVRGALISGHERVVLWDTLSHPRDMLPFLPMIENRQLIIIYSHADWDHVWGTAGIPGYFPLIIAQAACRTRFDTDVPATLREKQAAEPFRWHDVRLVPPNLTFQRELSLDLGGIALTLHHLPGHAPDSIVAFLPEQGILLAGDAVETPFPAISPECPLRHWIEELERWERDPRVQTIIPSHGDIGGKELLRRNIAYLQGLLDGNDLTLPDTLSDFYRKTHQENRRICGR